MDERLPGKIETEPQYIIKFFAQWKLVIDTINHWLRNPAPKE